MKELPLCVGKLDLAFDIFLYIKYIYARICIVVTEVFITPYGDDSTLPTKRPSSNFLSRRTHYTGSASTSWAEMLTQSLSLDQNGI